MNNISTRSIVYHDEKTELTGFLARPVTTTKKTPGVLIIHEWWGHETYCQMRAKQLAELGYIAFALDMYGTGKIAHDVETAQKLSSPFYADASLMISRAMKGLDILKAQEGVNENNIAAIGYCFGGTVALHLARASITLKAVVSFHGGLSTNCPAQKGAVKADILALNAGDDAFVSLDEKENFIKEMQNAGASLNVIEYAGAQHAFTNPAATENGKRFGIPVAYHAQADQESLDEMKKLFAKVMH